MESSFIVVDRNTGECVLLSELVELSGGNDIYSVLGFLSMYKDRYEVVKVVK